MARPLLSATRYTASLGFSDRSLVSVSIGGVSSIEPRPGAYSHCYSLFCRMQADPAGRRWTVIRPSIKAPRGSVDALGHRRTSMWWAHQDSNLEPRDYESPALTVEL